jgi:GTP-binding protein Era
MTSSPDNEAYRCGTAALVGRPNVGKSTLLNALIGWRLSIVSPKPQTTRHRILGVLTDPTSQILFLDTPGLHKTAGRAINRQLNKAARQTIAEADVVVQVIEAGRWTSEDQAVYEASTGREGRPHLLVLNKIDAKKDKKLLLPFIAELNASHAFGGIFLVSAVIFRKIHRHSPRTKSPIAANASSPPKWSASR